MIIKISTLSDGFNYLDYNEPVKTFGLEKPFFGDVELNLVLEKFPGRIILSAKLKVLLQLTCDRCTIDCDYPVESEYKMAYLFGIEPVDNGAIEVTYLPVDADRINIGEDVKDYLILGVPMKKLCKDDCKGLCSNCGEDLNFSKCKCSKEIIDERWLPLMELKKKINDN